MCKIIIFGGVKINIIMLLVVGVPIDFNEENFFCLFMLLLEGEEKECLPKFGVLISL